MPEISVIIPTYKHRDYVLQTLDSVFAQTFTDYEVIVVNDGSPDDTADVLRPLAEAGRIRYIEQANAGQGAARNRGIAEAQGEYIALLDDDDLWPPDKLQWQVELLKSDTNAVFVYGWASRLTQDETCGDIIYSEEPPSGSVNAFFSERNSITSPGQTLIRCETLIKIGGFDPNIWGADDWDLYARLSANGTVLYNHREALFYRIHGNNASSDAYRMYANCQRVRYKFLGRIPYPGKIAAWNRCRRFINDLYFDRCLEQAQRLISEGRNKQARQIFCTVLPNRPRAFFRKTVLNSLVLSIKG